MFVVMAVVATLTTTPLTNVLYPPWYQQKVEKWRRGEIDWDGNPTGSTAESSTGSVEKLDTIQIRRLLVYLRLDSLPSVFTFITLLGADTSQTAQQATAAASTRQDSVHVPKRPLEVHGVRLVELTDRTSSVMHVTEGEEYSSARDPVVNAFRTFSQLHDVAAAGRVSVVPVDSYPETLMSEASAMPFDFALIPWSEYGSLTEDQTVPYAINASERFRNGIHLDFIQRTLAKAAQTCTAGIFINNGFGGDVAKPSVLTRTLSAMSIHATVPESAAPPVTDKSHRVFLPFLGGADDRVALKFVLRLARNAVVTLTIAHFRFAGTTGADTEAETPVTVVRSSGQPAKTTLGGTTAVAPSDQADNISWAAEDEARDLALLRALRSSLPEELVRRVAFREVSVSSASPLEEVVDVAAGVVGRNPRNAGDIVVVGRRHARLGDDVVEISGGDFRKTVGAVADHIIGKGVKASLLVIQAGGQGLEP